MSSEWKACEHCRGVAKYETDLRNARVMFYVRCDACGVGTMGYKTGPEAAAAWNRRTPSPAVLALVEAAKEWREADDQLRGPFGAAAPQTAMNRLASRTVKLREALAAVEREIGDQFADASKKVEREIGGA